MIDTTRFAELVQRDQRSTAVRDQFLLLVAHDGMCAMMSAAGVILSNGGCQPISVTTDPLVVAGAAR